MRLLHTKELRFQEFYDADIPNYIILSHTWGAEECTLQSFEASKFSDTSQAGMCKVLDFCYLARSSSDWVWVDTCCIDKTSSAELSEAINSMFRWYEKATQCWVFLADVNVGPLMSSPFLSPDYRDSLQQSRWFTRGWTPQELLAPDLLRFFDSKWVEIGSIDKVHDKPMAGHPRKSTMVKIVSDITHISGTWLERPGQFWRASVAERMSWAAHRQTSRLEDRAYCLLGLFDVNMPLIFGEGKKAFQRLQKEIMSSIDDETIFAWWIPEYRFDYWESQQRMGSILADSPLDFEHSSGFFPGSLKIERPPVMLTSRGIQIHVDVPDNGLPQSGDGVAMFEPDVSLIPYEYELRLNYHHNDRFLVYVKLTRDHRTENQVFYRSPLDLTPSLPTESAVLEKTEKKFSKPSKSPIYLRV